MQGPGGAVGAAVERLMARIRPHLRPDDSGSPIHYNRTYEAVVDELTRLAAAAKAEAAIDAATKGFRP